MWHSKRVSAVRHLLTNRVKARQPVGVTFKSASHLKGTRRHDAHHDPPDAIALSPLASSGFKQKPNTTLCLIDPVLEKTCGSNVACIIAKAVYRTHAQIQRLLILFKLAQHVRGFNVIRIIIRYPLKAGDVSDGPYRHSTNLPHAFGNFIGHGKDLICVLIEKQMVVAKVRSAHVPVEVLRLQVKREYVREQSVERS